MWYVTRLKGQMIIGQGHKVVQHHNSVFNYSYFIFFNFSTFLYIVYNLLICLVIVLIIFLVLAVILLCLCFLFIADVCLWNSVAYGALSTTRVHSSRSHQLSNHQSAPEASIDVARPASDGLPTSKSLCDITVPSSTADNPCLIHQPQGLRMAASSTTADVPEAQSQVQTASHIVVEVESDNISRVPETVHRRRRKTAKKNSVVIGDERHRACSSWELLLWHHYHCCSLHSNNVSLISTLCCFVCIIECVLCYSIVDFIFNK